MSDSSKPRQRTPQPDMRPASLPKGPLRGSAYGKVRVINDWARSGDATKRPEFQPGYKSPSPYKARKAFSYTFKKR